MKHWWSSVTAALVVGLVSLFSNLPQTLGQYGRTWTVCAQGCDFATIQLAIEAALPKDIIRIEAGVYTENLVIQKDLSLIGAGPKQTVVKALDPNKPILYVPGDSGDSMVSISIRDMAFVGSPPSMPSPLCSGPEHRGQCPVGIEVGGKATLTLEQVRIEDVQGGIWGYGNSTVRAFSTVEIRDPRWYGLLLEGTAHFTIVDSIIHNPSSKWDYTPERYGVLMRDGTRLHMVGTTIRSNYNFVAMKLEGRAQATLEFVHIDQNRQGIMLHDDARATILSSAIMANSSAGIYAQDRAQLVLNYSLLALNLDAVSTVGESKAFIYKTTFILNYRGAGIFAADSAQVTLNYSRLLRNHIGVALRVSPCYILAPGQTQVKIFGQGNEIPSKKDDSEDGNVIALCPPDYPWPPGFRK